MSASFPFSLEKVFFFLFFFGFFDLPFEKYPHKKKYNTMKIPLAVRKRFFWTFMQTDTRWELLYRYNSMMNQKRVLIQKGEFTILDALHVLQMMLFRQNVLWFAEEFAQWYIHNHYLSICLQEDNIMTFRLEKVYGDTDFVIVRLVTLLVSTRSKTHRRASAHDTSTALSFKKAALSMFGMFH